ncbi:cytochrome c oxidase assembly protein [Burkholderia latens]|uniref:Membrane protein n=4 Tax=Burkholderia latens TaxID=488446 RepID=A0A6P2JZS4_9BURK|nr:cytochrome c oxidase assembly protein [Burkholderia latens]VWB49790.1 membrane protein [Burkholderia latens]
MSAAASGTSSTASAARAASAFVRCAMLLAAARASGAHAHVIAAGGTDANPFRWPFEPFVIALLAAAAVGYTLGYRRLARQSRHGRAQLARRAAAFAAGLATLFVALCTPLDTLGGALFSAHMVQHELLMIVAAPLAVLGRPLPTWLWALPPRARFRAARIARARGLRTTWRTATAPVPAWLLHAAALWIWHIPRCFDAALASPAVHALQHASFVGSALLFWRAVFDDAARPAHGASAALSLFTTMVHTAALGALITLSPGLWYVPYAETTTALGLAPLEDQQLGGLVMWVPAGLAYVAAALALVARWLRRPAGIRAEVR